MKYIITMDKQNLYFALKVAIESNGIKIDFRDFQKIYFSLLENLDIEFEDNEYKHELSVYQRALSLAILDNAKQDLLTYVDQAEKEIKAEGH